MVLLYAYNGGGGTSSISRKKDNSSIMRDLLVWVMGRRLVLTIELASVSAVNSMGTMDGPVKLYNCKQSVLNGCVQTGM